MYSGPELERIEIDSIADRFGPDVASEMRFAMGTNPVKIASFAEGLSRLEVPIFEQLAEENGIYPIGLIKR